MLLTAELAQDVVNVLGRDLEIPEYFTEIDNYAFAYSDITSIVIPDSVTTIGDYAFYNTSLRTVFIPESVTEISDISFDWDVIFISDKNNDGFSDEITNYHLFNKSGGVDLTNQSGRTYSDDSSRHWDLTKAVEVDSGFSILLEGDRRRDGYYRVVSARDNGVISGATRWLNDQQMFRNGYEEIFDVDFNGNNTIDLV